MKNKTLQTIVAAIGMQPTLHLLRAWGGKQIYIPGEVEEKHPIALTIGLDAARKLVNAMPARYIELPCDRPLLLEMRNSTICEEFRGGESVRGLSMRWGISRKMIHKILDRQGLREMAEAKA